MKPSNKHSYIYKIVEKSTSKFYIGYRTCKRITVPLDDCDLETRAIVYIIPEGLSFKR